MRLKKNHVLIERFWLNSSLLVIPWRKLFAILRFCGNGVGFTAAEHFKFTNILYKVEGFALIAAAWVGFSAGHENYLRQ